MKIKKNLAFVVFAMCLLLADASNALSAAPPQASAVGYNLETFHSSFRKDVDTDDTERSGFHWYLSKWFGWKPSSKNQLNFPATGGLEIVDGGDSANYTIGSAAEGRNLPYPNWVGTAFGGGGYFEAELKFDPNLATASGAVGFPAWWLEPIEHTSSLMRYTWPQETLGYEHFVEVDIFEYIRRKGQQENAYLGAVHEWYGLYKSTCNLQQFCEVNNSGKGSPFNNLVIATPQGTDFRQFHKFGELWVPATATTKGFLQYYFDGVATGDRVEWSQYNDEPPLPDGNPWAFGVLDKQHLVLILGSGVNQLVTVRSVEVWQHSSAKNLRH